MEVLRIEGARKRFGATEALQGLTMALRAGEMLALLGPNGAGKTTLIRALAGRVRLDGGTVTLFGRTLAPADARPELGVVPQELALYPLLSARENLEVFGALQGVRAPRLRERVRAEDVRAHHVLQFGGCRLDGGLFQVFAGVVDEAGDRPVLARDARDERGGGVELRDVVHHVGGAVAEAADGFGKLGLAPGDENDARPSGMHRFRDGETDAGAAAGDERVFAAQGKNFGE